MAIRPFLARGGVLNAVSMSRQVHSDRLNADNPRVRADIENLRGERMRHSDDGGLRLFAQIEPQAEGAMGGEIAGKNIGQRRAFIIIIAVILPLTGKIRVAVLADARIRHLTVIEMLGFRLRFLVAWTNEATFDPQRAVMVEDHERAAASEIVRIIGLPPGLQPLDVGFEFAETCR